MKLQSFEVSFRQLKLVLLGMSFLLCLFPLKMGRAMADANVDVKIPIEELQRLIQQLEDVTQGLTGQLGIELRRTVDELNDKITQQITNIKEASIDVLKAASAEIRAIIQTLTEEARKLLAEINQMVRDAIKCLDEVLAKRIAQIKDTMIELIDKTSVVIQQTIDRVRIGAAEIIDEGTSSVVVVLDKTLENAIRIGLLVAIFILLFWMVRTLYKQNINRMQTHQKIVMGFVTVVMIGMGTVLLSSSAMAKIAGKEIKIPKWEKYCEEGEAYYIQFITQKNNGASTADLHSIGIKALEALDMCRVATVSAEVARNKQVAINEISVILYPPAPTPEAIPASDPLVADCKSSSPSGPKKPFYPGWFSKYDVLKITTLAQMKKEKKIEVNDIYGRVSPQLMTVSAAQVETIYKQKISAYTKVSPSPAESPKVPALMFKYNGSLQRINSQP